MAHLTWQEVYDGTSGVILAIKLGRVFPSVLARALVPLLRFVAQNTGKWAITSYLEARYPRRTRKSGRSSSF